MVATVQTNRTLVNATGRAASSPRDTQSGAAVNSRRQASAAELARAAAERLQQFVKESGRDLRFSVDDQAGVIVVRVVDQSSGDVIRQIPSEEALRLARSLPAAGDVSSILDEQA
jgi:flagellar protein FlaG